MTLAGWCAITDCATFQWRGGAQVGGPRLRAAPAYGMAGHPQELLALDGSVHFQKIQYRQDAGS